MGPTDQRSVISDLTNQTQPYTIPEPSHLNQIPNPFESQANQTQKKKKKEAEERREDSVGTAYVAPSNIRLQPSLLHPLQLPSFPQDEAGKSHLACYLSSLHRTQSKKEKKKQQKGLFSHVLSPGSLLICALVLGLTCSLGLN